MTGIKISELSIGDWVVLENQPFKVIGINPPYIDLLGNGNRLRLSDIDNDNLSPIHLTPEILEKNGLEYIDDGNDAVIFLCCDMFWARLCVGDTFWQVGIHSEDRLDAVVCAVKHTHHLQHALRLAGVKKELEL